MIGGVAMERWRDIPGYEGIYQASTFGNVRTCEGKVTRSKRYEVRRWRQRILKQKYHGSGRNRLDARVTLWKDGKPKTWLVSRLIGLAWCDGYSDGMTINHINGDSLDNRSENLEWLSLADNIKHGFDNGLYGTQKLTILCNDSVVLDFRSMAEASKFLGRNHGYVHNCIKTNRKATGADGIMYDIEVTP